MHLHVTTSIHCNVPGWKGSHISSAVRGYFWKICDIRAPIHVEIKMACYGSANSARMQSSHKCVILLCPARALCEPFHLGILMLKYNVHYQSI